MTGLFLFIILVLAVLQLIYPAQMIMFGKRWQFKEGTEPSDIAIAMARISSVIAIIVVIFVMLSSCGA